MGVAIERSASCKRCERAFVATSSHHQYCSDACRWPAKTCERCGKSFSDRNHKTKRWCSKSCAALARDMSAVRALVKPRKPQTTDKVCATCGTGFRAASPRQLRCKTCIPDRAAAARFRYYGITGPQWVELVDKYDGKCWICQDAPATDLDHDHKTGAVRGALCTRCNLWLARFEDDEWQARARRYLNGR